MQVVQRGRSIDVLLGVLLLAAVAATFTPWLRSGDARRSSYEVVRSADRLELLGPVARRAGRVVWATLPLAAALGLLALVRERRMLAGALALWVAAACGSLAAALRRAPEAADWGTGVAVVVAVALGIVGALTLVGARRTP